MENRDSTRDLLDLSTSNKTPDIYDVAIIGAGINGCTSAYFLSQANQKVVLIDQDGNAAGGSGAAGAFISPKFTKGGLLKELLEEAYLFSLNFYSQNFPKHIQKAKLLQIANSEENALRLNDFKKSTTLSLLEGRKEVDEILTTEAKEAVSALLEEGGVVNAQVMCQALSANIELMKFKVEYLSYEGGLWKIGDISARKVILATGSYDVVMKMPYLELRRVWGHRIDVKTDTKVAHSIHHHLSISPSSQEGIVAIGATHNLHFNPFSSETYDIEAGRKELLEKAAISVNLENVEVIKDYTGLRSGSNDYLPIVGPIVDVKETMNEAFKVSKIKQMKDESFSYFSELYMINGTGGYGFVLAPYLAQQLTQHIVEGVPLKTALTPTRFFRRWAKKQG